MPAVMTQPNTASTADKASPLPSVSVVVATKNREGMLRALLSCLEAQTLDREAFEVLVVDDGSTDGTRAALEEAVQQGKLNLRALSHEQSRGPAAARNHGWRSARGELIAFTDDDCEPVAAWLERILAEAEANPGQIIQGRVLPNPREAGNAGAFSRSLLVDRPSPHYETANVLYPRAVLEELDGFDEQYGAPAGEDTDLGWRSRARGVDYVFAPTALVHHAVHQRGAMNTLRDALRATDSVRPYRDHPGLRAHLDMGHFYDRSHAFLLQAALAVALARRTPATLLFAAPYVAHMVRRGRIEGKPLHAAPFFVLRDAVEVYATLRGAVRHRVPII
jgi:glycosyltransferase involved in cell wall biosynthesis